MRILLVNDYGTAEGGAEIQMLRLREMLRERGHDARLFTTDIESRGSVNEADYKCVGTRSPFRILLQTLNPWAYLKLGEIVREFRPDIVHVKIFLTQLSPLILPLLKNIPSLYHVAWYRPICPLGTKLLPDGGICNVKAGIACYQNGCLPIRDWLPLMLQMRLFGAWKGSFDSILANSEWVRNRLIADGIGPVDVLHYGVRESEEEPGLSDSPTVAFAGRLVPEKGLDVLIRAFKTVSERVPDARLLIAGDGPERKNIVQLISTLKLSSSVSMLGHVKPANLTDRLRGAWVQAVPSLWDEPFGIVAIEAMMRGTVIVASNSGGLSEIIEDGTTGLLVPPGDICALAEKLTTLLNDKALIISMGKSGRDAVIARFSEEAFLDRLLGVYSSILRAYDREPNNPCIE